jgi:CHASE2 domain-containing sensor protein
VGDLIYWALVEVVALVGTVVAFRRRARESAYMLLVLAEIVPLMEVSRSGLPLASWLPFPAILAVEIVSFLLGMATLVAYIARHPARVRSKDRQPEHD